MALNGGNTRRAAAISLLPVRFEQRVNRLLPYWAAIAVLRKMPPEMTNTLLGKFNHAGVMGKWLKATLPQLHDCIRTLSITVLKPSTLRRAYAARIHEN